MLSDMFSSPCLFSLTAVKPQLPFEGCLKGSFTGLLKHFDTDVDVVTRVSEGAACALGDLNMRYCAKKPLYQGSYYVGCIWSV